MTTGGGGLTASAPSQFSSMPLSGVSAAPGRIAGLASLQSMRALKPSSSSSAAATVQLRRRRRRCCRRGRRRGPRTAGAGGQALEGDADVAGREGCASRRHWKVPSSLDGELEGLLVDRLGARPRRVRRWGRGTPPARRCRRSKSGPPGRGRSRPPRPWRGRGRCGRHPGGSRTPWTRGCPGPSGRNRQAATESNEQSKLTPVNEEKTKVGDLTFEKSAGPLTNAVSRMRKFRAG